MTHSVPGAVCCVSARAYDRVQIHVSMLVCLRSVRAHGDMSVHARLYLASFFPPHFCSKSLACAGVPARV